MAHDLIIRNGLIVDGSGRPAFRGDLAIDGDVITEVGAVAGSARREIDANGNAVTPGFVDLHTHFDAQAGWDPMLTPASWHGVTTALIGNCGVTFAPCKPKDRQFLASMMETVEDIPRAAILGGLAWDWETYGEYLSSIERLNPAINLAGLVGHCATRFYVMGERAVDEDPSADEIAQIADLVGSSIRDGAVGFSSNRLPGHVLPDGRSIPGTFAKSAELSAISAAVGANNGILQFVLDYARVGDELDLISEQAQIAGTRLLFSAPAQSETSAEGKSSVYVDRIRKMRELGVDVSGLTLPRSGGFLSGLTTDILPCGAPAWKALRALPFDQRLIHIRDASNRMALIEAAAGDEALALRAKHTYWLGSQDQPHYTQSRDQSLAGIAAATGEQPAESWLRRMLETDGLALFHVRFFNHDLQQVGRFLKEDWVLPGLGDAGAHVSQICDAGWPSFLLSHWLREQQEFSVEEAIRKMTSAQARVIGLTDRGLLAVGKRADVNVIDLDRVAERQPQLVHDFPGGAPRLIQKAVGYEATICNGTVILRNDLHTGDRAGRVLRNNA